MNEKMDIASSVVSVLIIAKEWDMACIICLPWLRWYNVTSFKFGVVALNWDETFDTMLLVSSHIIVATHSKLGLAVLAPGITAELPANAHGKQ